MKKYTTTVSAVQLTKENDPKKREDQTFSDVPVKYNNDDAFAIVNIGGAAKTVNEGDWLVEYPDGVVEIFNDKAFKKDFVEAPKGKEEEKEVVNPAKEKAEKK